MDLLTADGVFYAFNKYGFDDGDHPLASDVMQDLHNAARELGSEVGWASSIHNDGCLGFTDWVKNGQTILHAEDRYLIEEDEELLESLEPSQVVRVLEDNGMEDVVKAFRRYAHRTGTYFIQMMEGSLDEFKQEMKELGDLID